MFQPPVPPENAADDRSRPGLLHEGDLQTQRVRHIFRTSLRADHVHPLLHLLLTHRHRHPLQRGARPVPAPGPAAPATLTRAIDEAAVRRCVAALPPLPRAAQRAMQSLRQDDASVDQIGADLACDAALAARVLRLANSPFYGVQRRVSSVPDAVQLLGRRTLEQVVLMALVPAQFGVARSRQFDVVAFWRHALASATLCRSLAPEAGVDGSLAFIAALLHDIGLLAMSVYFPEDLDDLVTAAHADDQPLHVVECARGQTSHARVGAWIADHWNFPPAVVQAIACHDDVQVASEGDRRLTACVHLACTLAHALDVSGLEDERVPALDPMAWALMQPSAAALPQILEEAEAEVAGLFLALNL